MPRDAEQLRLFPSSGWLSEDESHWLLPVHAWVFHPEEDSRRRALLIQLLRKGAGIESKGPEAILLAQRMKPFLVDNKRGRRPWVQVGTTRNQLPATNPGGHTHAVVRLPRDLPAGAHTMNGWIESDDSHYPGQAFLLEAEGLSVISDIDDTIKHSEVGDTSRLLRNTFTRSFSTVTGMPRLYRDWEARGARFHYVSSSPWQLFEPLNDMIHDSGLPPGSMHLKRFRLKDRSALSLFKDPRSTKPPVIQGLLDHWPRRRFVLVGDSGELDPEVYGQIARKNPGRIHAIYIRQLNHQDRGDARYEKAFSGLDPELWSLFQDPLKLECRF